MDSNHSNELPLNESISCIDSKDIQKADSNPNPKPELSDATAAKEAEADAGPPDDVLKPIESEVHQNGSLEEVLDQNQKQSIDAKPEDNCLNDIQLTEKDNTLVEITPKSEELTNGSVVTPKVTRNKRKSSQVMANTPIEPKTNDIQSEGNCEQRLTRSRYGRIQKVKTPNPEMIYMRRSSLKSSDNGVENNLSIGEDMKAVDSKEDSNRNVRKSKRKMSETPKESPRKRKSKKLDSVINEMKSNSNETEATTRPNAQMQSSKKKSISRDCRDSVPQKKRIELTGDPTSRIVDRHVLIQIPPQEGEHSVGDLIWAKVSGYPWWPCMVSVDPIVALYSKISGTSYKAGRVYHVQYFGPQALRGWTTVGQVMPFEGREKYSQKLESMKESSPKAQSAKIAAKFAIKASLKKQWDQSVDEAEEAAKMDKEERVRALTFEYILSSKPNLKRKLDNCVDEEMDAKRKKLNSSPEDIYDFDDDADAVNVSQSTPGLMWRKRVHSRGGDFATYVERHFDTVEKENPSASRTELEDMLQRRWDLLGDDLRGLYTDRKFAQNNDNESDSVSTPKPKPKALSTTKSKMDSNRKSNGSRKSKAKKDSTKLEEQNDSNGSESEGNLVIAETPVKKSANKKALKSSPKANTQSLNASIDLNKSSKKLVNSEKKLEPKASQKKATPKRGTGRTPKSKKCVQKPTEENGITEKPMAPNSDQPLVAFGIDYIDEFTSSEDTSSTSEPEAVDGQKTSYHRFCAICKDSEDLDSLIPCQGCCLQMFHIKCVQLEGNDNQFKCNECETGKHKCFVCKSVENKEQKEAQKCNDSKCGKFYHLSCIEKGFPFKMNDLCDSFLCPLHTCLNCHIESQNDKDFRQSRRRLVKCISCPTAYHLGDYCIAAGTVVVSQNHVICPDHHEKKKKDRHVNVNYCFSCLTGGQLICCESCPAAFHTSCLDYTLDPDSNFYCGDCMARKPLHYGDVVWVKLGFYRWWPGKVCHPKQVPDNVMKLAHGVGEFPVYFFGSHDYYWVHRGRVFLFMEGDNKVAAANSAGKKSSKSLLKTFKLATEEAAEHFKLWEEATTAIRKGMVVNKPPAYTHIKFNKPVGLKVQITNSDESHISLCECKVKNDLTCNDENCINRALMVECDPKLCRAGDQCKNQRFKKREYVSCKPFKTASAGWGLRAQEDVKKGQFVTEYVGELIDEEECERRLKAMGDNNESNFYFLTIDKNKIIDAGPKGNLARFMNHSCQPNCETQKWMVNGATRVGLFAISDIPAGTELTFNYNLDCRGNEKTKCICLSANCSGFIGVRPNKTDDNHNKKTNASNGQNSKKKMKKKKAVRNVK